MAEQSLIGWTDHAFTGWFGCTEVGEACNNCYAKDWTVHRFHKAEWGLHAQRVRTADSTWRMPLAWQRKAAAAGVRRRVFDVFDNQASDEWRADLWALIAKCPDLDWLLLTKRPQNIAKMLPAAN